jgi:hypothetical protein
MPNSKHADSDRHAFMDRWPGAPPHRSTSDFFARSAAVNHGHKITRAAEKPAAADAPAGFFDSLAALLVMPMLDLPSPRRW